MQKIVHGKLQLKLRLGREQNRHRVNPQEASGISFKVAVCNCRIKDQQCKC